MLTPSHSRLLACLTIAIALAGHAHAGQHLPRHGALDLKQVQPDGLTVDQASKVLAMTLRHEGLMRDKPGFNIEHTPDFVSGYAAFFVTFDSPNAAATSVIGSFVVSPITGDVWETNLCKRYAFPALEKTQATIMQRTGKTFADEASERRSLGCADE